MKDWHDLGSGCRAAFFDGQDGAKKVGMFVEHPRPGGKGTCEGTISLKPSPHEPGRPLWTLVSEDPLTISPSLDCTACGWHKNIVGGRIQ